MEHRIAVVARKYTLKTKKNNKWDINCPARVDGGLKVHATDFIESINGVDNNVHYVTDEEATKNYLKEMESRIVASQERKALSSMTPGDILRESLKISQNNNSSTEKNKDEEIEKLRSECDSKGIEYSSRAGINKLTQLLNQE